MPPQDSDGGSGSSQAESTLRGRLAMGTPGFGPLREGLLSPSSGALEGLPEALAGGQTLRLKHCGVVSTPWRGWTPQGCRRLVSAGGHGDWGIPGRLEKPSWQGSGSEGLACS